IETRVQSEELLGKFFVVLLRRTDLLHCLQLCSLSQRISLFAVILSLVSLSSALVQIVAVVVLSQVVK
ncbi:hypothetical protein S245_005686, partial [Arachis hypogaea]